MTDDDNGGLLVTSLAASHGEQLVLRHVDLRVPQRALACILGPSGCGKTTLLRAIAGFHVPSSGTITLNDRVLDTASGTHLPAEKRRIGYIPQDVGLFPHLTVRGNIAFGLRRGDRSGRERRLVELMELTDLNGLSRRYPHELSGGQQQRVAIARALAADPELLLLDEPFSALDSHLRARVRAEVVDLLRATGTTAVMVTHDAAEALAFADLITVMEQGRVLQSGTPQQLHDQPTSATVARALGEANVLAATWAPQGALTCLGSMSLTAGPPQAPFEVLIRPRQLSVEAIADGADAVAEVRRSSFQGEDHRLELTAKSSGDTLVAYSRTPFTIGAGVAVSVAGPVHPMSVSVSPA
ncbi:iron(III) transport system ATP-binding protein [Frankineae bacterium MT45]|nr:iron(III) transport system ATP-binding protein [Frankineae bacterium MT45]